MTIQLRNGVGSDLQIFGYDEDLLPLAERAVQRKAAKSAWRRLLQELYTDDDQRPFAVLEWRHTIKRISVQLLDVSASPSICRRTA